MEAGRELDAEIAEKVMGWRWWRRLNPITGQKWLAESAAPPDSMVGEAIPCEADSDLMPEAFDGPEYSSSIAAAWTVVEKMRELGWLVSVKSMPAEASFVMEGSRSEYDAPMPDRLFGTGRVACELSWMGDGFRPREWSVTDTAPLAICRAALEAVAKKERGI